MENVWDWLADGHSWAAELPIWAALATLAGAAVAVIVYILVKPEGGERITLPSGETVRRGLRTPEPAGEEPAPAPSLMFAKARVSGEGPWAAISTGEFAAVQASVDRSEAIRRSRAEGRQEAVESRARSNGHRPSASPSPR